LPGHVFLGHPRKLSGLASAIEPGRRPSPMLNATS
jgi:hypothetical protein